VQILHKSLFSNNTNMKIRFFFIIYLLSFQAFSQKEENKFIISIGAEYRITPFNLNTLKLEYVNFTSYDAFMSGVPVNINIRHLLNKNWDIGFKYHFRWDYLIQPNAENYLIFGLENIHKTFVSDYTFFLQKNFYLKENNKLNLSLGYNFMNHGAIIEKYSNYKRESIRYNINSFNTEIFYQYKFFHIGLGVYWAPEFLKNITIEELYLPYFSLYFDLFKF